MDLRQLETFCKVAELESFSRAAEAVYLTQPTVSGHITALERSMGLKLLDRLGRKATLTNAGKILYRYSKDILRLRSEALNAMYEYSHLIKGRITIGGSTIAGEYFLPKVMGAFNKENPGVSISLVIADSQEIADLLVAGEVELGVTGMKFNGKKIHCHRLFQDRVIIVAHPHHPLAQRKRVSWDEILKTPLLIREKGSGTRKAFESHAAQAGHTLDEFTVVSEVGSSTAVKQGVKAQIGLGFISDLAVEEEMREGKIAAIDVDGPEPPTREFFAVTPKGRELSPPARGFLEFLMNWRIGPA